MDCLEGLKQLDNESIDIIFTDPPYKLIAGGGKRNVGESYSKEAKNGTIFKHNSIKFNQWIPLLFNILKEERYLFIMANDRNIREVWDECEKTGFIFCEILVMNKTNGVPSVYFYKSCEYILMFRKGKYRKLEKFGIKNVIDVKMPRGKDKIHPTQKPEEIIIPIIESCSKEGEIILDPFMGSGVTAKVAKMMNRNYIGFELDNTYCELANKQMEESKM